MNGWRKIYTNSANDLSLNAFIQPQTKFSSSELNIFINKSLFSIEICSHKETLFESKITDTQDDVSIINLILCSIFINSIHLDQIQFSCYPLFPLLLLFQSRFKLKVAFCRQIHFRRFFLPRISYRKRYIFSIHGTPSAHNFISM